MTLFHLLNLCSWSRRVHTRPTQDPEIVTTEECFQSCEKKHHTSTSSVEKMLFKPTKFIKNLETFRAKYTSFEFVTCPLYSGTVKYVQRGREFEFLILQDKNMKFRVYYWPFTQGPRPPSSYEQNPFPLLPQSLCFSALFHSTSEEQAGFKPACT